MDIFECFRDACHEKLDAAAAIDFGKLLLQFVNAFLANWSTAYHFVAAT